MDLGKIWKVHASIVRIYGIKKRIWKLKLKDLRFGNWKLENLQIGQSGLFAVILCTSFVIKLCEGGTGKL